MTVDHDASINKEEFVRGFFRYFMQHQDQMSASLSDELDTEIGRTDTERAEDKALQATAGQKGKGGKEAYRTRDVASGADDLEEGESSDEEEDDGSDDEEEVPDWLDTHSLSEEEQHSLLKKRAFLMMGVGTIVVLLFSDPMVSVLDEVGDRTGIPSFLSL